MKSLEPRFRLLYALILLAAILRLVDGLVNNPLHHLFSDPQRHWDNGLRFLHPGLMGASDPILYQIYIFLLRRVTGDNSLAIGLAAGLLSVLMPWTYYRAVRELGWAKYPALVAWALISWMPSLWSIYDFIMMETLLLPLLGFALWMTARFLRKSTCSAFLIMVFTWTLAMLTKPSILPLAVIAFGYSWWQTKIRWSWMIYAGLLVLAMLIPPSIRAYPVLGFVAPFGQPWIAKIIYRMPTKHIVIYEQNSYCIFSSPSAYVQPLQPLGYWMIRRSYNDDKYAFHVDPHYGERDWKAAYAGIPFGWKEWVSNQFENIGLLLFAPSWPETTLGKPLAPLNYHSRWIWAPLILLVIIGNLQRYGWKQPWDLLPMATTGLLLFLLIQPFALMEGRYRKPLEPFLLLNAVLLFMPPPLSRKEPAS